MAKKEMYVCDYQHCGNKGFSDGGELPAYWFELTINNKSGSQTLHICPKHEVVITDPWGGSFVFDHTELAKEQASENEPAERK